MRLTGSAALAFVLLGVLARPVAAAQLTVTSADIQRLDDSINEASRDVSQLRARDASLASQLQADLEDARDEATYLKVKLRRNESISRSDYSDLRAKVENIRNRARGEASGGYTPPVSNSDQTTGTSGSIQSSSSDDVPVGTEFDMRVQNTLSSATAQVEDRFEGTTIVDLRKDGRI